MMNKKAQSNTNLSGILMVAGVVLIVIGGLYWMPIAYLGVIIFVAGLAIRNFMNM